MVTVVLTLALPVKEPGAFTVVVVEQTKMILSQLAAAGVMGLLGLYGVTVERTQTH